MFELLEMTGRIRELFAENPEGNESRIRRAATEAGMVTLMQQAAALAVAGAISIDEAYRFGYAGEAS
jgi:type II secretory ATPase GspE/PulE/Tfp pilus assembly ATPase PilB-like protein